MNEEMLYAPEQTVMVSLMDNDELPAQAFIDDLPIWEICLEFAGRATPDALTLSLATCWLRAPAEANVANRRARFEAVHEAACRILNEEPHAPDLRTRDERSAAERRALDRTARLLAKAAKLYATHAIPIILEEGLKAHIKEVPEKSFESVP